MAMKYNPYSGTLDVVLGPGSGTAAIEFATDSGNANPTGAGVITIAGGTGLNTAGSSSTVTINLDSPVVETNGGTGQTTYTTGDILYASGANTLAKLAVGSNTEVLTLAGGVPTWAAPTVGTVTSVSGTTNRITSTGGATPVIDIDAAYVGQASITTLGTITTGTWNGTTIDVANGGTGAMTLTDHGILLGSGTGAITPLGAATNGQLPIGSTGADPVLASLTAPAAGITITGGAGSITFALADDLAALEGLSGTGLVTRTAANTYAERTITGTSNEIDVADGNGVSGNPTLSFSATPEVAQLTIDPGASGDSFIQHNINSVAKFRVGVDDDNSDKYTIAIGSALGSSNCFVMTTAGERTLPLNPCFLVRPTSNTTNVTGDNTDYTIVWGTEIFDQNSDFDGTSTFTAPVSGRYLMTYTIGMYGITSSHTQSLATITTSNREYAQKLNPFACSQSGIFNYTASFVCDMDAADTATVTIRLTGGTKVADLAANGGGQTDSYFSGCLVS